MTRYKTFPNAFSEVATENKDMSQNGLFVRNVARSLNDLYSCPTARTTVYFKQ